MRHLTIYLLMNTRSIMAVDLEPNDGGLPRWCSCQNCIVTSLEVTAVCCNDRPEIMELLSVNHVIQQTHFGLNYQKQYSPARISLQRVH